MILLLTGCSESKKLSTSDKEKLMDYINNLSNPFNEKVNFHFIENKYKGSLFVVSVRI